MAKSVKKFKKSFIIKALNKISKENINNESALIDIEASNNVQNQQFAVMQAMGKNFIMSNIDNVIRYQLYKHLREGGPLAERDFAFWKNSPENGTQLIYENELKGSTRTGNIINDASKISPEPEVEIQNVNYDHHIAVDMRSNKQLQTWATLKTFENWINQRYGNALLSIDRHIHNNLLEVIDSYVGYHEIMLDVTGLNDEEKAKAFEKVLGEKISELSSGYIEQYGGGGKDKNFVNLFNPEDIGLILSNKNFVNREVDYLRKQFKSDVNAPKDWGLGAIINKNLSGADQAILLPRQKFNWGSTYGSIESSFGYALLQGLKTDYAFWGSVMMKSVLGFRITAKEDISGNGIKYEYKNELLAKKTKAIEYLTKRIQILKNQKTELTPDAELISTVQYEKLLEQIKKYDVAKQIEAIEVITPNKPIPPKIEIINPLSLPDTKAEVNNVLEDEIKKLKEEKKTLLNQNKKIKTAHKQLQNLVKHQKANTQKEEKDDSNNSSS